MAAAGDCARHRTVQIRTGNRSSPAPTLADDLRQALATIAARRRATHVFVPYREVGGLRRIRERSLVERVLERLPDVEVHAVGPPSRPDGG